MAAVYNLKKREEQILARFSKSPPSFAVHLHPGHWTLNKDNSARNFLYTSPAVSILESIRAHRVPVDMLEMFDQANVPFYDGCLIVEEHDHMTSSEPASDPPSNPGKLKANPSQIRRIVLYPNGETLWADISLMNARNGSTWTDQQAIEFEAKVLAATAPPLCLDPDPIASRIAAIAMSSTSFDSAKRKHSSVENDKRDDGARKAERDKFMNVMNPRSTRIFHADFRQHVFLEQRRRGEQGPSPPPRSPSPQPSLAPTPTPPPTSAPTSLASIDELSSSQKKKSKKKKTDTADSPMQVDAPSPGFSSKSKPRKNSVSQGSAPQLNGGKKKHGQNSRRGTASSVEPSPANLVMQLPPNGASGQSVDSPQSVQASPSSATAKKEDSQSALGIGAPPLSGHSPVPTYQQLVSGGPPKKRMKTETPAIASVPLPGGSQQGTPQQSHVALTPQMPAPAQQPVPTPRYSVSPAPAPGGIAGQQPHPQYPGQLAYNYGNLGMNIANGMTVNNGTGQPGQPGYNPLQLPQQSQALNMHANLLAAQNQQQAAARAGSPHSLPPSRPASQAGIARNSPRQAAPLTLGPNGAANLQPPQQDQQGARPGSTPGQQGMPQAAGMQQSQNPMPMPMDASMQMAMFQQMQQRMGFPGAPNMMQYPGFPMQIPGQPAWRMPAPGQLPMGVGRGQPMPLQYAAALQQRRNATAAAMQAPPNPQR
ncbi:Transcription factor spt20 [Ceratobasidium sp. UAMH 11750]|nr:Transcription factor spt20 [Ceratobasidium sp. UAMH 11750]